MKNAMRASPVVLAQNEVKPVALTPGFASLTRATAFVQHSTMNTIAKIDAPANSTAAPGIVARKSVMSQAPANQASDHAATRTNSFALRGSARTDGSTCGNEMTSANSTQL